MAPLGSDAIPRLTEAFKSASSDTRQQKGW